MVLCYYRDTKILIKTSILLKHCPGLEFHLIPKLISWDPVHDTEKHNPEWHNPEWTQSRMDTIPNGHNPKWT